MALRLGIDLDGVVADFTGGWISAYNEHFDAELRPEMITAWDGMYELTHFPNRQAFWAWARDHGGHSVFRHLAVYPGAIETLTRLRAVGHHVVVITAKPGWAVHDTFRWLADHRFPTREVHITRRKFEVDCDLYLDDSPDQLRQLVRHRGDRTVCRFVRPWNDPVAGAVDVTGWDAFKALVDAGGVAD